jgi:hypothetical protein
VSHIEKLTDLLVLLPPIFLLKTGTIQSGLVSTAVPELEIRRCSSLVDDAAPEHERF